MNTIDTHSESHDGKPGSSRSVSASSLPIEIRPVTDTRDQEAFLDLPHLLYADDPNWVAPLRIQAREVFDPRHPVREHLDAAFFLAWQGGRTVGRISAQIDALYEPRDGIPTGLFGMFEAEDDPAIATALMDAARNWLAARSVARIQGPFNLNINQEVGLLVEGFESSPYFMMGHGRRCYPGHMQAAGLRPAKDLLAYELPVRFEVPKVMQRMLRGFDAKVCLRSIRRSHVSEDLEILRILFNDAWQDNWGFVPFTEAEFQAIGKELVRLLPPSFIQIAELDGEPEAFIVLVPNLNEAIRDLDGRLLPLGWARLIWRLFVRYPGSGRVPLMGVRSRHHNTALGAALALGLIHGLRQPAIDKGLERVELSWILEDNGGMRSIIESLGGSVSKRYRIYEGGLPTSTQD